MTSALRRFLRSLPPFGRASHDVLYGVPQSGKTTLARALVADLPRVWFYDETHHDFTSEGEVCGVEDLTSDPLLTDGVFSRVVVHPRGRDDFAHFIAAARSAGRRRPLLVVCDEVGNYAQRHAEVLTQLHCNGHHYGVTSLLVTQFAVQVPKTCRRSAGRAFSLLQDMPDDLEALADAYGQAFADTVAKWQPGDPPAVWTRRTLYPTNRAPRG